MTKFDKFIDTSSAAIREALNQPLGQELTRQLLQMKLAENPAMSPEEWARTKSEFMTWIFCQLMETHEDLRKQMCDALWETLRAGEVDRT